MFSFCLNGMENLLLCLQVTDSKKLINSTAINRDKRRLMYAAEELRLPAVFITRLGQISQKFAQNLDCRQRSVKKWHHLE